MDFFDFFEMSSPDSNRGVTTLTVHGEFSNVKTGLQSFDPGKDVWFLPAKIWLDYTGEPLLKENVAGSTVLWVDYDNPNYPQTVLPPSLVIFSGGGYHFYWRLSSTIEPLEIERLNKWMIETIPGADKACWNCNRLLRVPGTLNTKYDPPRPVKIYKETGIVYDVEDISMLSKLDGKAMHKIRTGDMRGYRTRSERDWAVITSLVDAGARDELIQLIFEHQPVGSKVNDPTTPQSYLSHTIEKARSRQPRSGSVGTPTRGVPQDGPAMLRSEISVGGDGYYRASGRRAHRISTFTINPRLLLDASGSGAADAIMGDVLAAGYQWPGVAFSRTAFTRVDRLDKECPIAAWQWLGTDSDVRNLLPFLMDQLQEMGMPRVLATPTLGLHKVKGEWMYVGDSQTISKDCVWEGFTGPIAALPTGRERPKMDLSPLCPQDGIGSLEWIGRTLPKMHREDVIWPMIGWYISSLSKPWLESRGYRFPVLNVAGTKGSGKTTLIQRVFMPLLGQKECKTYDSGTTKFVTLALLGGSNACPVAFSEFRYSTVMGFIRYILLSYDTGHDPRGRGDQTTVDYPLSAPFSVDGEDVIGDPAAQERMVAALPRKADVDEGSLAYETYNQWAEVQPNMAQQAIQFGLRAIYSGDADGYLEGARDDSFAAFPGRMPDRIRRNHIVARFGQRIFCELTGCPLPEFDVLGTSIRAVFNTSSGRSRQVVDDFVESVANAVTGCTSSFQYARTSDGQVVFFQLSSAHAWWLSNLRRQGKSGLELAAIKNQLGEVAYILAARNVGGAWMYGINLRLAQENGLDVTFKPVEVKQ